MANAAGFPTFAPRAALIFGAVFAGASGLLALSACGEGDPVKEISITCRPEPGVDAKAAAEFCAEAFGFVQQRYPLCSLQQDGTKPPALHLTVTQASARAAGLSAVWEDAEGATHATKPLRTAFYDTNSNPALRLRFLTRFFEMNPPPF